MNNITFATVGNLRITGKALAVFDMLNILATTEPIEQDRNWWSVRAYIISKDQDKYPSLPMALRRN